MKEFLKIKQNKTKQPERITAVTDETGQEEAPLLELDPNAQENFQLQDSFCKLSASSSIRDVNELASICLEVRRLIRETKSKEERSYIN